MMRYRITAEAYHKMAEAGLIGGDERVELLEGELYRRSPTGPQHLRAVGRLNAALIRALGEEAFVSVQSSFRLSEISEPEPDIAVLMPPDSRYARRLPEPQDAYLVIEVADTTLKTGRAVELPLYAEASIPELWIMDAGTNTLEVYRDPLPERREYGTRLTFKAGTAVAPAAFPEARLEWWLD